MSVTRPPQAAATVVTKLAMVQPIAAMSSTHQMSAQTLVARRVGLVVLALHLALLGGGIAAGGLLLDLALLGRLLRRLHGDRGRRP